MIQRIALLAGGLGAAAVLAFALGLTNFVFAGPGATKQTADTQPAAQAADSGVSATTDSQSNGAASDGAKTKKVVDKVYIAPTPAPKVVHVNPTAPATQSHPQNTVPAKPKTPAASHNDGNRGNGGQESEHSGGNRGHGGDD